ncbi:MAG: phosphoglucosamine mutase [Halobacteriales archaeon]
MKVFGSSGTRGVANEELTPAFVLRVATAAGSVWDADRVALGRDTRVTGPMLGDAAASGLQSVGADVERLGIVPTPGLQAYCEAEAIPGIMITASHNPAEYNGIKLVGDDGVELPVTKLERVEDVFLADSVEPIQWDQVGTSRSIDIGRDRYIDQLKTALDRDAIADAGLTVALDPGHGAGTLTSPRFLRELGCDVVTVNAQADGHFPGRDPEPVEANLADLGRLVRTADADVGIAHDGDADRAIFFDEEGSYIEGDATLAALAAAELSARTIAVSAVNVSQRLVDIVESIGADLELTAIGSTRIITRIRELQADGETVAVAGEGNGGIIFPDYRLARDGAYTAGKFLELLTERSAREIIEEYDGYHNDRRKIEYDTDDELATLQQAAADYAADADGDVTTIDGHRIDYGDAWILARPSGTEPVVRIYAEARTPERAATLADEIETQLVQAIE